MTETAAALLASGQRNDLETETFVVPSTFNWQLGGDDDMDRPPSLTFFEEESQAISTPASVAVVVNALDQRGGAPMTTRPRETSSSWCPDVAAPLLAATGGDRTTDIDGGTYVVTHE